jgi:hypothetical protein
MGLCRRPVPRIRQLMRGALEEFVIQHLKTNWRELTFTAGSASKICDFHLDEIPHSRRSIRLHSFWKYYLQWTRRGELG